VIKHHKLKYAYRRIQNHTFAVISADVTELKECYCNDFSAARGINVNLTVSYLIHLTFFNLFSQQQSFHSAVIRYNMTYNV